MPTHYLEIGTSLLINILAANLPTPLYTILRPPLDKALEFARATDKRRTFATCTPPPPIDAKSLKIDNPTPPVMPECWGHRGASAAFPENTIASFERAIRDGSEGIESDVHVTSDDVIIMFHDPSLERTTNGKGLIKNQPWKDCIELVRTTAEPRQQLPTFREVCDLLMRPENKHVKLNIDIKPENEPDRLFRLMKGVIQSYPDYASDLGPRLILGLWHPVFLDAALEHVPTMRRIHIGGSPWLARTYFWKHCDGFSMWFPSLVGSDGQVFLDAARRDGKDVFVWTVNRKDEMIEATRWGVKAILTDKTDLLQVVREKMTGDFSSYRRDQVGFFFGWASWKYYTPLKWILTAHWLSQLEKRAGITFKEAWIKAEGLEIPTTASIVDKTSGSSSTSTATGTTCPSPEPTTTPLQVPSLPLSSAVTRRDSQETTTSCSNDSVSRASTVVGSPSIISEATTATNSPLLYATDSGPGTQSDLKDEEEVNAETSLRESQSGIEKTTHPATTSTIPTSNLAIFPVLAAAA